MDDNQLWRLGDEHPVRLPWHADAADDLLLKERAGQIRSRHCVSSEGPESGLGTAATQLQQIIDTEIKPASADADADEGLVWVGRREIAENGGSVRIRAGDRWRDPHVIGAGSAIAADLRYALSTLATAS